MLPFSSALPDGIGCPVNAVGEGDSLPHTHSKASLCSLGQSSSRPRLNNSSPHPEHSSMMRPDASTECYNCGPDDHCVSIFPLLCSPTNCRPVVEGGIPPDGPLSVLPPHAWVKQNRAGESSPAATSLRQPRTGRGPALFRLSVLHPCPYGSTSTCLDLKRCSNSAV